MVSNCRPGLVAPRSVQLTRARPAPFLYAWRGRQHLRPKIGRLGGAPSHHGCGLTLAFCGQPATRRACHAIGRAEPHAHKWIAFGPWILQHISPGCPASFNDRHGHEHVTLEILARALTILYDKSSRPQNRARTGHISHACAKVLYSLPIGKYARTHSSQSEKR